MSDPREIHDAHVDAVLSDLMEGSIHTRMHMVHEAVQEVWFRRVEGVHPPSGNRKARRAAAAKARRKA